MDRAQLNQVIQCVNVHLQGSPYECIEAEWVGHERVLRLFIDKNSEGVKLDDCVRVTKDLLEVEELDRLIPGSYSLEVSSPGIERPLRSQSHFERFIGEMIQVRLLDKVFERRQGVGKLLAVADKMVTMETPQGPWSFPLDQVQKASLVHQWDR